MTAAFWVDSDHDRRHASDGTSRYGAYVRQRQPTLFAECWDGTRDEASIRQARFAAAAWQTGTSPVMAPAYIRQHPRVLSGWVGVSSWDQSLYGAVTLAVPWPAPLAGSRDWRDGQWWQDWQVQHVPGGPDSYREPDDSELGRGPFLLSTAQLMFPLPADRLPDAPASPRARLEVTARLAVTALVDAMNTVTGPVLDCLERA
jgi:hypothetical protein